MAEIAAVIVKKVVALATVDANKNNIIILNNARKASKMKFYGKYFSDSGSS